MGLWEFRAYRCRSLGVWGFGATKIMCGICGAYFMKVGVDKHSDLLACHWNTQMHLSYGTLTLLRGEDAYSTEWQ